MSPDNSSGTPVSAIMTKNLITVDSNTTVFQIANLMEKGGIGAILVKKDNVPAGIITDRDFAIKVAVNKIPLDTPVNKIASYPLQKINANDSILAAAEQMSSKKIRKLAVVNDDKVIGIITSTDIVTHLANKKNL